MNHLSPPTGHKAQPENCRSHAGSGTGADNGSRIHAGGITTGTPGRWTHSTAEGGSWPENGQNQSIH